MMANEAAKTVLKAADDPRHFPIGICDVISII